MVRPATAIRSLPRPHPGLAVLLLLLLWSATALAGDPFVGTFRYQDVTLELTKQGDQYTGTYHQGGYAFPVSASGEQGLSGTIGEAPRTRIFQATADGDTVHVTMSGQTFPFQRVGGGGSASQDGQGGGSAEASASTSASGTVVQQCTAIYTCVTSCPPTDQACSQGCLGGASQAAQQAFGAWGACVQAHGCLQGASQQQTQQCIESNCLAQTQACFQGSATASAGGAAASGTSSQGQAPAGGLTGAWSLMDTYGEYYDPRSGSFGGVSGNARGYTFRPDGTYSFSGLWQAGSYGVASEKSVYKSWVGQYEVRGSTIVLTRTESREIYKSDGVKKYDRPIAGVPDSYQLSVRTTRDPDSGKPVLQLQEIGPSSHDDEFYQTNGEYVYLGPPD